MFFAVDPALTVDPALSAKDYGFIDPYRISWLEEAVTLDLRDQPLDARRGGWFSLRAEEGGIWSGGDFDYEKIVLESARLLHAVAAADGSGAHRVRPGLLAGRKRNADDAALLPRRAGVASRLQLQSACRCRFHRGAPGQSGDPDWR